jgi:hypothetical protein
MTSAFPKPPVRWTRSGRNPLSAIATTCNYGSDVIQVMSENRTRLPAIFVQRAHSSETRSFMKSHTGTRLRGPRPDGASLKDPRRPCGADAVAVQKHHDFPHGLLLGPRRANGGRSQVGMRRTLSWILKGTKLLCETVATGLKTFLP